MSPRSLILLILLFAGLVGLVLLRRDAAPRPAVDLVEKLSQAERRHSAPENDFVVKPLSLGGVTKPAISAYPLTRLTYRLTLPTGARLRAAMALDEAAWKAEGTGAQFRVAVSSAKGYEQLLVQQVDPYGRPGDRRWVPLLIDLSRYGGQRVDLILSTECGPGRSPDCRNDYAYWGSPEITLR